MGTASLPVEPFKNYRYVSCTMEESADFTVTVPFDRQALADYLCVDRSALSRTIGQLRREGVLEADRRKFRLKALPESVN